TSPHLLTVNERMRIDGESISDAEFSEIYNRVDSAARKLVAAGQLPQPPSFFEMLTAMAFEYFASAGVEIAILEVGMGGRLDATPRGVTGINYVPNVTPGAALFDNLRPAATQIGQFLRTRYFLDVMARKF